MDGMRAAFARTTTALLDEDPRVALVLAEISVSGYLSRAIERHPERAVNIGIAEQAMVGIAAGFAMEGFHPIAHSIGAFVAERPYEQLKLDIGYQGLGGTFVGVGGSYDYAAEGATHHAPADAQVMSAIPRMQVLAPGHEREVDALLRATYANGEPTYVRIGSAANPEPFDVAPGRIEVVAHGGAATVLAFGPMLWPTLARLRGARRHDPVRHQPAAVRRRDPRRHPQRDADRGRGRAVVRGHGGGGRHRRDGPPAGPVRLDRGPAHVHPHLRDPRGPRP